MISIPLSEPVARTVGACQKAAAKRMAKTCHCNTFILNFVVCNRFIYTCDIVIINFHSSP